MLFTYSFSKREEKKGAAYPSVPHCCCKEQCCGDGDDRAPRGAFKHGVWCDVWSLLWWAAEPGGVKSHAGSERAKKS